MRCGIGALCGNCKQGRSAQPTPLVRLRGGCGLRAVVGKQMQEGGGLTSEAAADFNTQHNRRQRDDRNSGHSAA